MAWLSHEQKGHDRDDYTRMELERCLTTARNIMAGHRQDLDYDVEEVEEDFYIKGRYAYIMDKKVNWHSDGEYAIEVAQTYIEVLKAHVQSVTQRQIYEPMFQELKDRIEHLGGKLETGKQVDVELPRKHKVGIQEWTLDYNEYDYYFLYDKLSELEALLAERKRKASHVHETPTMV